MKPFLLFCRRFRTLKTFEPWIQSATQDESHLIITLLFNIIYDCHIGPIRFLQLWGLHHRAVFLSACWALGLALSDSAITSLQSQGSVCMCVGVCMCIGVCVWACAPRLNGRALRPAGLEQNQENILCDNMLSRRDLGWNHSRTEQNSSCQVIKIMSLICF